MADYNKPFYKSVKRKLGGSFRWWNIPYCPHCKRRLGLLVAEQKPSECPMCHGTLDWRIDNG
nr:MAG TPA: DNA-directed RNA polymerase [Caudoviricetes sp.]